MEAKAMIRYDEHTIEKIDMLKLALRFPLLSLDVYLISNWYSGWWFFFKKKKQQQLQSRFTEAWMRMQYGAVEMMTSFTV